jgi:hypothetical protein
MNSKMTCACSGLPAPGKHTARSAGYQGRHTTSRSIKTTQNLFFQLISARCEHASLILTSNLPFARWGEVFVDQIVDAAMIDRIVQHADVISLKAPASVDTRALGWEGGLPAAWRPVVRSRCAGTRAPRRTP